MVHTSTKADQDRSLCGFLLVMEGYFLLPLSAWIPLSAEGLKSPQSHKSPPLPVWTLFFSSPLWLFLVLQTPPDSPFTPL